MIKIAITGSLASGKSTASKILATSKGPLFSADKIVSDLYKNEKFRRYLSVKLKIKNPLNIKSKLKNKIATNKSTITKLENIIHPLVRKEMIKFEKKYKNKKFIFFEIPLLVEGKLMKNFDIIFFIKAKKSIRLSRFKLKGGDRGLFSTLNRKQLSDRKKIKFCDHVVVNEKNKKILKKNLLSIMKKYE